MSISCFRPLIKLNLKQTHTTYKTPKHHFRTSSEHFNLPSSKETSPNDGEQPPCRCYTGHQEVPPTRIISLFVDCSFAIKLYICRYRNRQRTSSTLSLLFFQCSFKLQFPCFSVPPPFGQHFCCTKLQLK